MLNSVIHIIAREGPYIFFLFAIAEGLLLLKENKGPKHEYVAAILIWVLFTIWGYYGGSWGREYRPISLVLVTAFSMAILLIGLLLVNKILLSMKRPVVKHAVLMALTVLFFYLWLIVYLILGCIFIKCS